MTKFNNHKTALLSFALVVMLSLAASAADAIPVSQTYTLSGVTLSDGTTLSGYFTTNVYGYMTSIDITSMTDPNNGVITGYTYDLGIPSVTNDASGGGIGSILGGSQTDGATTVDILRTVGPGDDESDLHLVFDTALGQGITLINTAASYDCVGSYSCYADSAAPNGGIRTMSSGEIKDVPEPAPIALLGVGLLGLIAARRRLL